MKGGTEASHNLATPGAFRNVQMCPVLNFFCHVARRDSGLYHNTSSRSSGAVAAASLREACPRLQSEVNAPAQNTQLRKHSAV